MSGEESLFPAGFEAAAKESYEAAQLVMEADYPQYHARPWDDQDEEVQIAWRQAIMPDCTCKDLGWHHELHDPRCAWAIAYGIAYREGVGW